jgi:phosphonate transport system ATP-binding protein
VLQKLVGNFAQHPVQHLKSVDTVAIAVTDLTRRYRIGGSWKSALDGVTLDFNKGQIVGLIGPSGSGKSTLLRHITGLTLAENRSSRVEVLGRLVQQGGRAAGDLRRVRRDIGFIFQQFNLVDRLPLLTNVLIGRLGRMIHLRRWTGWFTAAEVCDAMAALDRVGISSHADQRAGTLSGGQQQRAAIARVLVQRARIILADEPIASLDPESSRKVMEALRDINQRDGVTMIVCLHQVEFAKRYCHRIVALKEGRVVFDGEPALLNRSFLTEIYEAEAEDAGIDALTEANADPQPMAHQPYC